MGESLLRVGVWIGATILALCAPATAVVRSVELRSNVESRIAFELIELLAVEPGGEPSDEAIRRSLRNLQASGVVGRAEAYVEKFPDGEAVVFEVVQKLQVRSVSIQRDECLSESTLRSAIDQREDTSLSESQLLRGVYRLQDLLTQSGYPRASVVLDVSIEEPIRAADVIYRVQCFEPTLVSSIAFEGNFARFSEDELLASMRIAVGERLETLRVEEDIERLEGWLVKRGYLTAEVERPEAVYSPDQTRVALVFPVSPGPEYEIRVSGFDGDVLRRRGLLAALEGERFDQALLVQTVVKVREDLQGRGHFRARVEPRLTEGPDLVTIDLLIEAGPKFTLARLDVTGNKVLTTRSLLQRVGTSSSRAFIRGSGRLVSTALEDDFRNLRRYYALEGFPEARIGPARIEEQGDELAVEIPIVEGPRQQVVEVHFPGLESLELDVQALPIRAGGPFHARRVEETAAELRARYEDAGFLSAQVASNVRWPAAGNLAEVTFEILEGPRVIVDRVVARGNRRVDIRLLNRTIELGPGDIVSRRRLLAVQRELYRLGVFSRVDVRLAPAMPFADRRDVLVDVEEGRAQKGSFGLGYDSEDGLRTLLGYSHTNLFGRGVATRFDLRLSEREQQARLLVRQPFVGRFRFPLTYSLFGVVQEQESFESERRGFQVSGEFQRAFARYSVLFTVKNVEVEDPDPALQALEIDRDLQEVDIVSLTPRVLLDRRDDPLIPTRGWSLSFQSEYAFAALGTSAEFLKLFGQHTAYVELGRLGVLAASLRLGAIEAPADSSTLDPTVPGDLNSARVPISERFFAGGRSTHRAFRRDLLGVEGETLILVPEEDGTVRRVPIGGNGLALLNLDYRFPIVGALGGTAFVDFGNVFGEWQSIDLSELELGAGVGVRFLSPIGPLRLEVGWPLDRDLDRDAVVFLSFGNPF